MANSLEIKMDLPSDAELARMFDAVPVLERYKVADKVLDAGAKPVIKRARQLAPRSTAEDRNKRSEKQRGSADYDYPLWKTIKRVIRKYNRGSNGVAIIGPEWPKGNKAYFNTSPSGNKGSLWGHAGQRYQRRATKASTSYHDYRAPKAKARAAVRNWIAQAFDETKPQQLAAMKTKLKSLMQEIWTR